MSVSDRAWTAANQQGVESFRDLAHRARSGKLDVVVGGQEVKRRAENWALALLALIDNARPRSAEQAEEARIADNVRRVAAIEEKAARERHHAKRVQEMHYKALAACGDEGLLRP